MFIHFPGSVLDLDLAILPGNFGQVTAFILFSEVLKLQDSPDPDQLWAKQLKMTRFVACFYSCLVVSRFFQTETM